MKVFITGISGFLGQHIAARLAQEGVEMVANIRPTSDVSHLSEYGIKFITANLRDPEWMEKALKGVDMVVHAATSKGGPWPTFYEDNVKSTESLLDACVKNKVKRFVYISSVAVYDHSDVKDGAVIPEDKAFETVFSNHYSRSKIEAEQLVTRYHRDHGLETVVLRPAALYGPGGLLFPARLGIAAGGGAYIVLGNGKKVLTLTHVHSVANAIALALKADACVGKAYNLVEDEVVSKVDYLHALQKDLNPEFKIIKLAYPLARFIAWGMRTMLKIMGQQAPTRLAPAYLRLFTLSLYYSNEAAKADLGWTPVNHVKASMAETMQWHASRKKPVSQHLISKGPVVINSRETLNVAIVGCGAFSKIHLNIMKNIANGHVVALCDPNESAAQAMAEKYGIAKIYTSFEEMLKTEKLDVVHLVSPAQVHADQAIKAMKAGCHVLVEKPMAVNAKEAKEMLKVAKETGMTLCTEHTYLYDEAMIEARELINNGALGKIVQVESWFGTSFSSNAGSPYLKYEARNHWTYSLPGGLFQNFMSHPLSVLLDVMGDVTEVKASAKFKKIVPFQKSDELRILLENDAVLGTLTLSFDATPRQNYLNIYGTEGTIKIDFMNGTMLLNKDVGALPKFISRNVVQMRHAKIMRKAARKNLRKALTGKANIFEGNERLVRLFYKALLENAPNPVTAENGLKSMEVMDKIWKQVAI